MNSEKKFIYSTDNGGFKDYQIVDNVSFVYTLTPENEKDIPDLITSVINTVFSKVTSEYKDQADGFINVRTSLVPYNNALIFHIYGDIAKRD